MPESDFILDSTLFLPSMVPTRKYLPAELRNFVILILLYQSELLTILWMKHKINSYSSN